MNTLSPLQQAYLHARCSVAHAGKAITALTAAMNKAQILGLIRHLATTAGGILVINPDPRYQAAGALLIAIGGGSSIYSKRTASATETANEESK